MVSSSQVEEHRASSPIHARSAKHRRSSAATRRFQAKTTKTPARSAKHRRSSAATRRFQAKTTKTPARSAKYRRSSAATRRFQAEPRQFTPDQQNTADHRQQPADSRPKPRQFPALPNNLFDTKKGVDEFIEARYPFLAMKNKRRHNHEMPGRHDRPGVFHMRRPEGGLSG